MSSSVGLGLQWRKAHSESLKRAPDRGVRVGLGLLGAVIGSLRGVPFLLWLLRMGYR